MTAVLRTARVVWRCDGCAGTYAPGINRWYVQGQDMETGAPRTLCMCPSCYAEDDHGEDGDPWPFRDAEDTDFGRCNRWDMVGRGRRVTRAAMLARLQSPRIDTASDAVASAESTAMAARGSMMHPSWHPYYRIRHDDYLSRIPGPLLTC